MPSASTRRTYSRPDLALRAEGRGRRPVVGLVAVEGRLTPLQREPALFRLAQHLDHAVVEPGTRRSSRREAMEGRTSACPRAAKRETFPSPPTSPSVSRTTCAASLRRRECGPPAPLAPHRVVDSIGLRGAHRVRVPEDVEHVLAGEFVDGVPTAATWRASGASQPWTSGSIKIHNRMSLRTPWAPHRPRTGHETAGGSGSRAH